MSYLENAKPVKAKLDAIKAVGDIVTEIMQSDKIGYDWHIHYVNHIEVMREYVEQPIAMGTAENPIVWKEGITPIENAYYLVDGIRMVYMSGEFIEF